MYNSVILNSRDEIVAFLDTDLKSGTEVEYSSQRSSDALNADREYSLVNARTGRISKAREYLEEFEGEEDEWIAIENEEGEFYLI